MDYLGFYSCLLTTLVFEYCSILTLSAIQIFFTDRQTIILIEVPPAFKNALLISHLIWITVLAKPNVPKKGLSIWKFIYRMALAFSRPWSFWGWDLSSTSTISAVSPPRCWSDLGNSSITPCCWSKVGNIGQLESDVA